MMANRPAELPAWMTWEQRPFPDANLLLLGGGQPALVDSGFVGHARETADWVRERAGGLELVVNTHWHSDHVGGNALLQAAGAGIAASAPDAEAVNGRKPGCCVAEYLDQPVAPYSVDVALRDGQVLKLGEADWEVIGTPGHTAGHVSLWEPDTRTLVVGDALSSYDVGWVNLALDGPEAAGVAVASLNRLVDLSPAVLLPAHGPVPSDVGAAFGVALRRAQRLVDDPDGAVWYGARRIFAYALMIQDGIPTDEVEAYLLARAWVGDAARLLRATPESLADELVTGMERSGAIEVRDGRIRASAPYELVVPGAMDVPFPREWPPVALDTAGDDDGSHDVR